MGNVICPLASELSHSPRERCGCSHFFFKGNTAFSACHISFLSTPSASTWARLSSLSSSGWPPCLPCHGRSPPPYPNAHSATSFIFQSLTVPFPRSRSLTTPYALQKHLTGLAPEAVSGFWKPLTPLFHNSGHSLSESHSYLLKRMHVRKNAGSSSETAQTSSSL